MWGWGIAKIIPRFLYCRLVLKYSYCNILNTATIMFVICINTACASRQTNRYWHCNIPPPNWMHASSWHGGISTISLFNQGAPSIWAILETQLKQAHTKMGGLVPVTRESPRRSFIILIRNLDVISGSHSDVSHAFFTQEPNNATGYKCVWCAFYDSSLRSLRRVRYNSLSWWTHRPYITHDDLVPSA